MKSNPEILRLVLEIKKALQNRGSLCYEAFISFGHSECASKQEAKNNRSDEMNFFRRFSLLNMVQNSKMDDN